MSPLAPLIAVIAAILGVGLLGTYSILGAVPPTLTAFGVFLLAVYGVLAVFCLYGLRWPLRVLMALAVAVIALNTLSPIHLSIMLNFEMPLNALTLILGGYVLQPLVFLFSYLALKRHPKAGAHPR